MIMNHIFQFGDKDMKVGKTKTKDLEVKIGMSIISETGSVLIICMIYKSILILIE